MATKLVVEALIDGKWEDIHNQDIHLAMSKEIIKSSAATISRTIKQQVRVRKVTDKILFTSQKPAAA